jgi:hypothetical protein
MRPLLFKFQACGNCHKLKVLTRSLNALFKDGIPIQAGQPRPRLSTEQLSTESEARKLVLLTCYTIARADWGKKKVWRHDAEKCGDRGREESEAPIDASVKKAHEISFAVR